MSCGGRGGGAPRSRGGQVHNPEPEDEEELLLELRRLVVPTQDAGSRADVWLSVRLSSWSRSGAARAIREGRVRSALRTLKPSSVLHALEELELEVARARPPGPRPPCPPLLYEDARVAVFDKPAGMLAHPTGRVFAWGLITLARERYPGESLHLAHRLDRETSGVSVVARDDDANRALKRAFKERHVHKRYLAVVRGLPPWERLQVDAPLGRDEGSPILLRQAVRSDGQAARTDLEVLLRCPERGLSLVRATPWTGRTHQIRVHLEHVGFPILGDKLYGQPPEVFLSIFEGRPLPDLAERLGHPRHALHAEHLELPHPEGGLVQVSSPLPADLAQRLGLA